MSKDAVECAPRLIGFHVHLFLVPKKNRKLGPILNMKLLNHFIVAKGFNIATLKMVT